MSDCGAMIPLSRLAKGDVVPEQVRYSLILWETMQVLREAAGPLTASHVIETVAARIQPTAYEGNTSEEGRSAGRTSCISSLAMRQPSAG
jgi:hypothetical protein